MAGPARRCLPESRSREPLSPWLTPTKNYHQLESVRYCQPPAAASLIRSSSAHVTQVYGETTERYVSRLLWQLGVGELAMLEGEGWTLLAQGNHVLWSERRGVQEGARWSLTPKVGSR
jgi:hypothetical protein